MPENPTIQKLENGLTFMGLVGMIDPPRPEVRDAVAVCRKAGIKPVMITGDHVVTASAIARDLGILEEGDKAITGAQLGEMSEKELTEKVRHISVYARVSPEDKIRIVKAWQDQFGFILGTAAFAPGVEDNGPQAAGGVIVKVQGKGLAADGLFGLKYAVEAGA